MQAPPRRNRAFDCVVVPGIFSRSSSALQLFQACSKDIFFAEATGEIPSVAARTSAAVAARFRRLRSMIASFPVEVASFAVTLGTRQINLEHFNFLVSDFTCRFFFPATRRVAAKIHPTTRRRALV